MEEEFSSWVSLKDLFLLSTTNIGDSSSVNDKILNSHIIEVDFKGIFLRSSLINNYNIESKGNGLMGFDSSKDSGNDLTPVG